ncbi:MAG: hypothetical protein V4563_14375, partial [Pseudomonadota bacterium]
LQSRTSSIELVRREGAGQSIRTKAPKSRSPVSLSSGGHRMTVMPESSSSGAVWHAWAAHQLLAHEDTRCVNAL